MSARNWRSRIKVLLGSWVVDSVFNEACLIIVITDQAFNRKSSKSFDEYCLGR